MNQIINLKLIDNQTEDICLEAVKKNKCAIPFIQDKIIIDLLEKAVNGGNNNGKTF